MAARPNDSPGEPAAEPVGLVGDPRARSRSSRRNARRNGVFVRQGPGPRRAGVVPRRECGRRAGQRAAGRVPGHVRSLRAAAPGPLLSRIDQGPSARGELRLPLGAGGRRGVELPPRRVRRAQGDRDRRRQPALGVYESLRRAAAQAPHRVRSTRSSPTTRREASSWPTSPRKTSSPHAQLPSRSHTR